MLPAMTLASDSPAYRRGHLPRYKGMRYPADLPTVEEIVAVMRQAGETTYGVRAIGETASTCRADATLVTSSALA